MDNIHIIYGAPGCGKTTKLMNILVEELKTTPANRIAYVSFTRKGTYEGVERAKQLYNLSEADMPYFRTLHSIAFRLGNYSKHDMISKSDYKTFSTAMGMKFTGYYTEEFYANDDKYLFMHFMGRNNPKMAKTYEHTLDLRKFKEVDLNYRRFKAFQKVVDFTDIIEAFIDADTPLPVDVAIIDEAQDLTSLQWKMCEVAFRGCKKVYIAGDDDQAIYEWSGADVDYFLNINATTKEVLHQSYRLQKKILDMAKQVTSLIGMRVDKQFSPLADNGNIFVYNDVNDIKLNTNETWYFLCRNNWFLQKYVEFLQKNGRIFTLKDVLSIVPKQIEIINIFEAARKRGRLTDTEELKMQLHFKGKADLTKPWYDNVNYPNDIIAYYRDLIRIKADLKDRKLMVNTIHGVKGGEADNVVIMLDYTKAVANNMSHNPDSELRCLYVALTRAKKHLHIVYSSSKNGYDSIIRSCI